MAESYISPKNGAVALPSGHGCDIASFDLDESQASESVASYGAQVYDFWRGSGTPHQSVSVGAFAKKGASGKSPGFGAMADGGGSGVLTADTGVTFTGAYLVTRIRMLHARLRAAVALTYQLETAGDPVIVWPVT